jgi:hypothetical protein
MTKKRLLRRLSICVFALTATIAQAADVDWKMFRMEIKELSGEKNVGTSFCFYDAKNLQQISNTIRVWIKCLAISEMNNIENVNKRVYEQIEPNLQQRIEERYVPPFAVIRKLVPLGADLRDSCYPEDNRRETAAIIHWEMVANLSDLVPLKPTVTMLVEVNCFERKMRIIQTTFRRTGQTGSDEWRYIEPERNSPVLEILCVSKR